MNLPLAKRRGETEAGGQADGDGRELRRRAADGEVRSSRVEDCDNCADSFGRSGPGENADNGKAVWSEIAGMDKE